MKICVVGLRGMPLVMGGIEAHCAQLFTIIDQLLPNADITVLARRAYVGREEYRHGRILVTPLWSPRSKHLETIVHTPLAILHARTSVKPEILHIHSIGAGLFAPLARLLRFRVVVTHHGEDYRRSKWSEPAKAVLRLGEFLSVLFAHKVIVVGRSLADRLRLRFPRHAHKIHYVPNGAPAAAALGISSEDTSVLERFGLRKKEYVLSVGRLVPEKGFENLITAVKAQEGRLELVIAGGSDHEDAFARSLMSDAGEHVKFTGPQFGEPLWDLYRNASLFVLASSHEGLPIAALEAISLGVPVLLSDIEAHTDLGLPPVCYFRAGDDLHLEEKLSQPHCMYEVNPDEIRKQYDWNAVAEQTVTIYRALMRNHNNEDQQGASRGNGEGSIVTLRNRLDTNEQISRARSLSSSRAGTRNRP